MDPRFTLALAVTIEAESFAAAELIADGITRSVRRHNPAGVDELPMMPGTDEPWSDVYDLIPEPSE